MNDGLRIRPMTDADVEAVSRIEAECFSMPWSAEAYRKTLKDEKCIYLVAQIGNEIIGMCGLMDLLGEGDISNVAVAAAHRGHGYAYQMLQQLILLGEERNITDFTLEVRESNLAAIRTYEKLGFVSEGVRPGFYDRPKEAAVIMWRRKV